MTRDEMAAADLYQSFCIFASGGLESGVREFRAHLRRHSDTAVTDEQIEALVKATADRWQRGGLPQA